MTMQHLTHPDDERLSALAGDDADARADAALTGHVAGCARCGAIVDDLRLLRSALGELPDLPPSRPLQLVPPVAAAPEGRGPTGWLRRLAAPAMAAGAGLALVGAVGFGTLALGGMAASAGAAPEITTDEGRGYDAPELMSRAPANFEGTAEPDPVDGDSAGEEADHRDSAAAPLLDLDSPAPWLVLMGGGVLLLLAGLVLRFAVQPRAG
jgi:hypothetical protein